VKARVAINTLIKSSRDASPRELQAGVLSVSSAMIVDKNQHTQRMALWPFFQINKSSSLTNPFFKWQHDHAR